MIRLMVRFGSWLDKRFPEKVVLQLSDLMALQARLEALEAKIDNVQKVAVHKDAVRDVVEVIRLMKDDFASFKTSMGMQNASKSELDTILNGEYIQHE